MAPWARDQPRSLRGTCRRSKPSVADRVIPSSPCIRIKLPKHEPTKVVPLPIGDGREAGRGGVSPLRALIILAAGTGLRQRECFGLTVDRVDFLRRTLTVDQEMLLLPRSKPKGPAPRRRPAIGPSRSPSSSSAPWPPTHSPFPAGPHGLIFTNDRPDRSAGPASVTCGGQR